MTLNLLHNINAEIFGPTYPNPINGWFLGQEFSFTADINIQLKEVTSSSLHSPSYLSIVEHTIFNYPC